MSLDKIKCFVKITGGTVRIVHVGLGFFLVSRYNAHIFISIFYMFVYRGFLFLYQSLIGIYIFTVYYILEWVQPNKKR